LIEQIQSTAIGLQEIGQPPQDQLQKIIEIKRRAERVADLAQR
jgi:hypothetical protein